MLANRWSDHLQRWRWPRKARPSSMAVDLRPSLPEPGHLQPSHCRLCFRRHLEARLRRWLLVQGWLRLRQRCFVGVDGGLSDGACAYAALWVHPGLGHGNAKIPSLENWMLRPMRWPKKREGSARGSRGTSWWAMRAQQQRRAGEYKCAERAEIDVGCLPRESGLRWMR